MIAALFALSVAHLSYATPGLTKSTVAKAGVVHCKHVTANAFEKFSEKVWRPIAWERGAPPRKVIRAQRAKLKCAAGPGHRKAIKHRWRADKHSFHRHRRKMLSDWCSPTPHPEGEGCWEIPAWCVRAESGESWTADNPESDARGPYQELGHGGPWPVLTRAEAMKHHRIAEQLYEAGGLDPWVACS